MPCQVLGSGVQHQICPQVDGLLVDWGGEGSVNADGGAVSMTELGYLGYIYTPAEQWVSAKMVVPRKVNILAIQVVLTLGYTPRNVIDVLGFCSDVIVNCAVGMGQLSLL